MRKKEKVESYREVAERIEKAIVTQQEQLEALVKATVDAKKAMLDLRKEILRCEAVSRKLASQQQRSTKGAW